MRINKVNIIELHCKVVTLILHSCLILPSTQLYIWNGRYDHILASVFLSLSLKLSRHIEWAEGRNRNGDFQVLEWFDHFMK